MLSIEKILKMKPSILRSWMQEEFLDSERHGDSNTAMKAERMSEAMYGVVDIPKMIAELAELLLNYSDFQVEQEKLRLIVRGKRKEEPKEAAGSIRLSLLHKTESDMVIASVGSTNNIYCNQLNFMDNMAGVFGMELALLVQNDERMKAFYLEYFEWLKPYYQQIMELRYDMETRLVRIISKLVKEYPNEEPFIAPITFNIAYLLHHVRGSLHHYRLPDVEKCSSLNLLGFNVAREELRFSSVIDFKTFNGLLVFCFDHERVEASFHKVISDYQTLLLVKDLIVQLERQPNPICQLFAQDLAKIMATVLLLKADKEMCNTIKEIENYLEILR